MRFFLPFLIFLSFSFRFSRSFSLLLFFSPSSYSSHLLFSLLLPFFSPTLFSPLSFFFLFDFGHLFDSPLLFSFILLKSLPSHYFSFLLFFRVVGSYSGFLLRPGFHHILLLCPFILPPPLSPSLLRSFAVNTLAPGSFTVHPPPPPPPDSLFCPRLFAPFASARPRLFSRLARPRSAAENSNRCSSPPPFNPPVLLLLLLFLLLLL